MPPGEHNILFRKVFDLIASEIYGTLICAGDFNKLLNPLLDTSNRKRKKNWSEKRISKALKDLGLIDVWRSLHGSNQDTRFTLHVTLPIQEQSISLCTTRTYIG